MKSIAKKFRGDNSIVNRGPSSNNGNLHLNKIMSSIWNGMIYMLIYAFGFRTGEVHDRHMSQEFQGAIQFMCRRRFPSKSNGIFNYYYSNFRSSDPLLQNSRPVGIGGWKHIGFGTGFRSHFRLGIRRFRVPICRQFLGAFLDGSTIRFQRDYYFGNKSKTTY